MPKKTKKLTPAEKRQQATAEHRAALKDFRRFDSRNETADYIRVKQRLDAAERAVPWYRR
jgi:hypothetical protein